MSLKNSSAENPWIFKSSRYVYQNPWIKVREDQVIRPDGQPGIYGIVEARTAVAILAIDDMDRVVMVGQYRYPLSAYSWELVEGGAEPNEDSLTAGKRELQEEAGLEANSWERLGSDIHLSNCFTSEVGVIYLARDLKSVPVNRDATEVLQVRHVPVVAVLEMIDAGNITDSLTIIAMLQYQRQFLRSKTS